MKKILALVLALCMIFALCACGQSATTAASTDTAATTTTETTTEEEATVEETVTDAVTYKVGICQLVQHEALDAATQGFMDEIVAELGEDAVVFDNQNASGDIPTCATICNGFAADGDYDLILANATAALQAASSATDTIPVLGTAITEYGVALGIDDFTGTVGTNVSGTSDLAPLTEQAAMFAELLPDAKTIGILYCNSEANSVYQAEVVQAALEDAGDTVKIYTFADSNDVAQVVLSACDECDALYIPTDNTAASCTETIANNATKPIIAGEVGIARACGIATLSIDYYSLGQTTGKMAVQILTGEADVSEMPIAYDENPVKMYNEELCTQYNITVPADYVAITAE